MIRKMAWTICFLAGCIWCLALVTRAGSAEPTAAQLPFQPVASVHSLMHGQQTFFQHIGDALKGGEGSKEKKDIREAAEVLAELANVNRHNMGEDDYRAFASQLRDTALQLAQEAKKKREADHEKMRKLFRKLKDTCTACHDVYR